MTLLNDGALTDPQLPATASHLCTLVQGWASKILATLVTSTGAKYKARATHVENVIKQATWVTICTTVDKQPDDGRHQDMHKL